MPHSRTTKTLSTKLGKHNPGSLDPAGCKGVSNRLFRVPGASSPTKVNDSKCRKSSINIDRSTKTSLQGGYPLSFTHQSRTRVFKHLIPCTENLKPLNRNIPYEHFKMEGIHMLKDLLKKGDYLVKIDLKDAYLTVPIWHKHQKYLRFLCKDNMWEFVCLPFGLASAPRVFTKLLKPVVAVLRQMGLRIIIYLDRYPDYVQIVRPSIDTCIDCTESFRGPRVCSKLRKVLSRTIPNNRVSWFRNKFTNPNNSPPKRQNQKDKEEVSRSTRQSKHISSRIIKIPGAPNFFHLGNFSGPSPLSQSSVCQEPGVETVSVLRNYCTSQSAGSTRDSMVEGPSNCLEWASHSETAHPTDDRDECFNQGLGCPLPGYKHREALVSRGSRAPHKLSRGPSWFFCIKDFCKRNGEGTHSSTFGQCFSSELHQHY